MSKRSKGRIYEIEFENLLKGWGYKTVRVKGAIKWNKSCDFWNRWDIIAFDDDGWLLAQIKTDYRNKVCNELQEWFNTNKPPKCTAIYVIRKKGKRTAHRWEIVYIGQRDITKILPIKVKK